MAEVLVPTAPEDHGSIPYTATQLDAIQHIDGNLQIIACAGSGKTQVISERVAEILERKKEEGIRPANIVSFTFTERAAAALKDRIAQCIRARLGEIPGLAELYVGTIHGYCLDLLQRHVPEYFKYQVLTEVQTRLVVDRNSNKSGMGGLGLKRYVDSKRYIDAINLLREGVIDWKALQGHKVVDALEMYERLLADKHYLDYTAIMSKAVELIEGDPSLRAELADRVRYLIVDEYQDVNPLQERLIRALHELGARVCVVGDDDQTLYQFRGTDITNILEFRHRYPDVRTVTIAENFRSSVGIVDVGRQVVARNVRRLPKEMESAGSQEFVRGDILCQTFSDPHEEANWIAERIGTMLGLGFADDPKAEPRGLAYSDFAVLFRSVKNNAGPILDALRRAGLPAVIVGYNNLFERFEIKACVALFAFMAGDAGEDQLASAWTAAGVGFSQGDWAAALAIMRTRRQWPSSERRALYTLQRTFLDFLEALKLREERIPSADGEVIFYNLGKFSQVISDYEQIHFHSDPQEKHRSFYQYLLHQAPDYYPEGAQDQALVKPVAVQVMNIHQAKGLEWPVVFIPALLKNRFPAAAIGGPSVWDIVPSPVVLNAADYKGGVEEERRVLYVAITRAQRYLYCSWAPITGKHNRYMKASPFVSELTRTERVLTRLPERKLPPPLPARPRKAIMNLALSFSKFKYFQECPYQFKLRFLYGFNAPLAEALGFGKSQHDALAEIHQRSLAGDIPKNTEVPEIVDRHLHVPFAYPSLRETLREAGIRNIDRYLTENRPNLGRLEHAEQVVELDLGDGIIVNGRIDLIRNLDTGETAIVDFKSNERVQDEDVSRMQLHVYTIGYRELTGRSADLIEVHELDKGRVIVREQVNPQLELETVEDIRRAARALRSNTLPRLTDWGETCSKCDFRGICRDKASA
jgi:DNA helicase II / ATP-dependent DNA helicase PcrA